MSIRKSLGWTVFVACFYTSKALAFQNTGGIHNSSYTVSWPQRDIGHFVYQINGTGKAVKINLPSFELDGVVVKAVVNSLQQAQPPVVLKNNVTEYLYEGPFKEKPALRLQLRLQVSPDNAVLRFQYTLKTAQRMRFTKTSGSDQLTYLAFQTPGSSLKEVRFSEFNERFHATHKTEALLNARYFENETALMGPLVVVPYGSSTFLAAYEHGSQYPDHFLEYRLHAGKQVTLHAVKGNYLNGQEVNGFTTIWLEVAGAPGGENLLSKTYRDFVLRYLSQNSETRKPYIFYNTWGRQERVQYTGAKYLASMNLDWTLREIEKAHAMGIEVFVLDAGWFKKTGDWDVNVDFFPDSLKQVKAKLDSYGMKLGLWFNPTVAALSSHMHNRNLANRMSWNGTYGTPREIWETEESVGLCLVSPYWEDFADKLIALSKSLGVTYFKWDAIGQYGCNDAHHYHGSDSNTLDERTQRYAFLQPQYMAKIVDKLCREVPQAIVDFDITEDGRCVGLQFLSAGKYFIINNGPYYHNFDLAPQWKSVLPSGNANIFVQPGPARGWFVRSVLDYDTWIPSVLFLTHYQPDEPRNSQLINIASLILGQNGIWGEVLKTSNSGVQFFDSVLRRYKQVRNDITTAQMVQTGAPGDSPEIYEKINPKTGKGCLVLFANSKGRYQYITVNKTVTTAWKTEGVTVEQDKAGRAVVSATFTEPSAKIILFGVQ